MRLSKFLTDLNSKNKDVQNSLRTRTKLPLRLITKCTLERQIEFRIKEWDARNKEESRNW